MKNAIEQLIKENKMRATTYISNGAVLMRQDLK